jgi:hypothetical protein
MRALLEHLVRTGGRARRRLVSHPPITQTGELARGAPDVCPRAFDHLHAAMRRHLRWADDYRHAGDLPSAITALVGASAIASEMGSDAADRRSR